MIVINIASILVLVLLSLAVYVSILAKRHYLALLVVLIEIALSVTFVVFYEPVRQELEIRQAKHNLAIAESKTKEIKALSLALGGPENYLTYKRLEKDAN